MMTWSDIIKDIRNKLILSQNDLAKLLGVSYATINRWENNHFEPTFKAKRKIIELCKKENIFIDSSIFDKEGGK